MRELWYCPIYLYFAHLKNYSMFLYTIPFISAIIGWITNFLAVKMLFHPKKKVNLGLFSIQGIFPKRQALLAEKLGAIVAKELFSFNDIKERFTTTESATEINKILDEKLEDFLENKLKALMPMLSMFINSDTKAKIKATLHEEFQHIFPDILNSFADKLEKDLNVEEIVTKKVAAFSSEKLEQILFSIMRKEFRFIEILGGVLGFVIGLVQLAILSFH